MRVRWKWISVAVLLVGATTTMHLEARAKAAFQSKAQMITNSEYIAVVDVKAMHNVSKMGFNWTYSKEADATLEKTLKGDLPKTFKIYGGENFICARVELASGRYLVFLNKAGELLIGSNWHLSVRPIKDGKIEWYDGQSVTALKAIPADDVLTEVKRNLGDEKDFAALPDDLKKLAHADVLEDDIVGEAPGPSEEQKIMKALRAHPPNLLDLSLISKYGTPAAKIYAAILIYGHDKESGKAALVNLSTCNSTLKYKSGCRIITAGLWDVASKLYSEGKFINLILSE